jgi:hypothetical protein
LLKLADRIDTASGADAEGDDDFEDMSDDDN